MISFFQQHKKMLTLNHKLKRSQREDTKKSPMNAHTAIIDFSIKKTLMEHIPWARHGAGP